MKEELIRSLMEGDGYKGEEVNDRTNSVKIYRKATPIIKEYETIIQIQKRNVIFFIQARVRIQNN